jgi:AraC-like DNA-binding protein
MHVAFDWLQQDGVSVAELAARLGYDSEAAFSRAFKRTVGMSPGAVRRSPPDTLPEPAGQPPVTVPNGLGRFGTEPPA